MIILYHKDTPNTEDCTFNLAIKGYFEVLEVGEKLYLPGLSAPIVNDKSKVGWFAVPEQEIALPQMDEADPPMEIPRTVSELNLHYDWPEGFIPLPGTSVPNKIANIENFLIRMFPTRGI